LLRPVHRGVVVEDAMADARRTGGIHRPCRAASAPHRTDPPARARDACRRCRTARAGARRSVRCSRSARPGGPATVPPWPRSPPPGPTGRRPRRSPAPGRRPAGRDAARAGADDARPAGTRRRALQPVQRGRAVGHHAVIADAALRPDPGRDVVGRAVAVRSG
jgi:hypothetical protein